MQKRYSMNIKDLAYFLFSFSQGQGIGLYFLYLCWVAQPVVRIRNIINKNRKLLPFFFWIRLKSALIKDLRQG